MEKHIKDNDDSIENGTFSDVSDDNSVVSDDFEPIIEDKGVDSKKVTDKIELPDFRSAKKSNKKRNDVNSDIDFSHIKDDDKTDAIDSFYRKSTIIRWSSFVVIGSIVSFIVYIVVSMFIDAQTPHVNIIQDDQDSVIIDTDDGTVGVASQGNFMVPLANEENFDFENIVVNESKVVNFSGQSVINSMNVLGMSFGNGYAIDNTNVCALEISTDFCFVAELKKEDANVANIYALSNVFQTKFFTLVENINKISIPGFEIAANGQSVVSGETKNTLFLVNSDGLTYVIIFNDNSAINDVTANISYLPVNNL